MIIEDGKGSGVKVGVTSENRIQTESIISSIEHHINHHDEEAYSLTFNQSPTAGDDCIFYLKNTKDKDLTVEGFLFGFKNASAVDAELYIKLGCAGTRNAATTLTAANLNAGSGKTAEGDFEKGADLDGGAATLSGGTEVMRFLFANIQDLETKSINFEQDLIIPKNQTMTFWASDAGATYYFTLLFNYHSKDFS
jgi:hypothetical protein